MSTIIAQSSPFLSLPLEIRQQIYVLVFRLRKCPDGGSPTSSVQRRRSRSALFLTSRQITLESLPIFYAMTRVHFLLPTPDHQLERLVHLPLMRHVAIVFANQKCGPTTDTVAIPIFETLRQFLATSVCVPRLKSLTIRLSNRPVWMSNGELCRATPKQVADGLRALVEEKDLRKVLRIYLVEARREIGMEGVQGLRLCLEELGMLQTKLCRCEIRQARACYELWIYAMPASDYGQGGRRGCVC